MLHSGSTCNDACKPSEDAHSSGFFDHGTGKARFDLAGYVAARLRRAGVGQIDGLARDTCAEEGLFFSFRRTTRRAEGRFGLQLSAIVLTE